MNSRKRPLRRALGLVGYSPHRWPTNRFNGTRHALLLLRRSGYFPGVIIDAGANVGNWTRMARSVFHDASIHLVEPQPACRRAVDDLSRRTPGLMVHSVTNPTYIRYLFSGRDRWRHGRTVARPGEREPSAVEDRALLKLDLEGHELTARQEARRLLDVVEVLLTELQFRTLGFEPYDFACLLQRPRDLRLCMGDVVFVRRDSALLADRSWA